MKYWKPIQIAFPDRDYPAITDEEKQKRQSSAVLKGKYRYLEAKPVESEKEQQRKAPEPIEAKRTSSVKRKKRS